MEKIAKRGTKILWGTSPNEPGIIEDTKTGERIETPVSVYATMNRGYWYPIDDERDSNTRDSIKRDRVSKQLAARRLAKPLVKRMLDSVRNNRLL